MPSHHHRRPVKGGLISVCPVRRYFRRALFLVANIVSCVTSSVGKDSGSVIHRRLFQGLLDYPMHVSFYQGKSVAEVVRVCTWPLEVSRPLAPIAGDVNRKVVAYSGVRGRVPPQFIDGACAVTSMELQLFGGLINVGHPSLAITSSTSSKAFISASPFLSALVPPHTMLWELKSPQVISSFLYSFSQSRISCAGIGVPCGRTYPRSMTSVRRPTHTRTATHFADRVHGPLVSSCT